MDFLGGASGKEHTGQCKMWVQSLGQEIEKEEKIFGASSRARSPSWYLTKPRQQFRNCDQKTYDILHWVGVSPIVRVVHDGCIRNKNLAFLKAHEITTKFSGNFGNQRRNFRTKNLLDWHKSVQPFKSCQLNFRTAASMAKRVNTKWESSLRKF